jgi:hypothetical protein
MEAQTIDVSLAPITGYRENQSMKFFACAILCLSILLSACATHYPQYPQSREDQATYHASAAKEAISENNFPEALFHIESALNRPTGDAKVKELFATYPKSRDLYFEYLEKEINDLSSADSATHLLEILTIAKSTGIFSHTKANNLLSELNEVVADGNMIGSIPFDLSDKIDSFPELKSPEHQRIIIDRTIEKLQSNSSLNRPIEGLIDYVQRVGKDSPEGKRVESLLPTMNIRRDELGLVARLFPEFAKARKDEITARVFVEFKNADRLFIEDLLQIFHDRIRGIDWVSATGPETTTVIIEQVRNNEKTLPEQTQTITYAQHEVNLVNAVLLMPKNASFLYEVVSGGIEIEYGYVISEVEDGRTICEEVIRGKVEAEYRRCQNARIRNVFGGITSANFVANKDMQQRCSGPTSVSMEDLRKEVFLEIADGVLKIPPIKTAHELN